ncbi:MAG: hypothetical protein K6T83_11020 [Alicyclobacillus sp.]|nr:hypothetical protein [Alicyclobacillus sp.]
MPPVYLSFERPRRFVVCSGFSPLPALPQSAERIPQERRHHLDPIKKRPRPPSLRAAAAYLQDALETDGAHVISVQYFGDDKAEIVKTIAAASSRSDYVVITGGVSAGDYDYVPRVLRELGGQLALERILMRPGAPLVGATVNGASVFAMSGNPAACVIQFELFVRSVIRRTLGLENKQFPASGKLKYPIHLKPMTLTRILRGEAVIKNGEVWIDTQMAQSPGVISGFAAANCLIRLDESDAAAGAIVPLHWLR